MRKPSIVALGVGLLLALAGLVVWSQSSQFASDGVSPDGAVVGGATGLKANRFYEAVGLVALSFGASLAAAALWSWFAERRRAGRGRPARV